MEAKAPQGWRPSSVCQSHDLIEMNVMGAMNANLAFYRGMADGGALDGLSEQDMLPRSGARGAGARRCRRLALALSCAGLSAPLG